MFNHEEQAYGTDRAGASEDRKRLRGRVCKIKGTTSRRSSQWFLYFKGRAGATGHLRKTTGLSHTGARLPKNPPRQMRFRANSP